MRSSGAVTALAIYSFRQSIRKSLAFFQRVRLRLDIAIVAGHAPIADSAAEACMIGPVVTGTHRPVAAVPGVPGNGKLYQPSRFRPADVAPGVIAGSDPIINPCLEDVGQDRKSTRLNSSHLGIS